METGGRILRKRGIDCLTHKLVTRMRAMENRLGAGFGSAVVAVQPFAHFLAGLEKRYALLIHRNMCTGARIAAGAGGAMLDRKCAEAAELDPVAAREGSGDFIEERVHDVLHI